MTGRGMTATSRPRGPAMRLLCAPPTLAWRICNLPIACAAPCCFRCPFPSRPVNLPARFLDALGALEMGDFVGLRSGRRRGVEFVGDPQRRLVAASRRSTPLQLKLFRENDVRKSCCFAFRGRGLSVCIVALSCMHLENVDSRRSSVNHAQCLRHPFRSLFPTISAPWLGTLSGEGRWTGAQSLDVVRHETHPAK